MKTLALTLSGLALVPLAGCGPAEASGSPIRLAQPYGLKPSFLIVPDDNPVTQAKAELGHTLFFDPRLSSTGQMSCATCHPPAKGWADGEVVSVKANGSKNTRNTPTVYNTGYLPKLYWDGREPTLESNILAAWKGQQGGDPAAVATALNAVPGYQKLFQDAFQGPATEQNIVQALATFLRTLQSGESPYDREKAGDSTAMSNDAKEGRDIFFGRAGCIACHLPPLFTDMNFHNVGIGMDKPEPDLGRGKFDTENPLMRGAFKTPTLREAANTAPYFHDGSVATLEEAVALMGKGGIQNPHRDPALADKQLSEADVKKIAAFIRSLATNPPHTPPKLP